MKTIGLAVLGVIGALAYCTIGFQLSDLVFRQRMQAGVQEPQLSRREGAYFIFAWPIPMTNLLWRVLRG